MPRFSAFLKISFACAGCLLAVPAAGSVLPVPSTSPSPAQQTQIDRRYGMFIHFGINTFANQEWTDGTRSPSTYAPTAIDAEQWVRTAYEAGMKYIILTAKHHDGFCLWDSAYTTYDVASSGNPTDVVRAAAEACEKYGIGLGIYYSLWDRNWNDGAMRPSFHAGEVQTITPGEINNYVDYMEAQLTELMSNYGDVIELWLDGGWALEPEDWQLERIYQHVKQLQPNCAISTNWTIGLPGNINYHRVLPEDQEEGYPFRYFPADFRLGDPYLPKFTDPKLFSHEGETYYLPFQSTITLTGKWFFHTSDIGNHRSVESLVWDYFRTTAQDNILIYNSPPNRDGVLRDADVNLLKAIGQRIGLQPGQPFAPNFSRGATASASAVWEADPRYEADKAIDENPDTRWASGPVGLSAATLEVDFGQPRTFDSVFINEYEEDGSGRVQSYTIDYWDGTQWVVAYSGTTIGELFYRMFPAVTGSKVRLNITHASEAPSIWQFRVEFGNKAFADWRESHFPGNADSLIASNGADPDWDGIPNILEYVQALNPRAVDVGSLPTLDTTVSSEGVTVDFDYRLRIGLDPDFMAVQMSDTLVTWDDLVPDGGTIVESILDPDINSEGTAELRRIRIVLPADDRISFFRLATD